MLSSLFRDQKSATLRRQRYILHFAFSQKTTPARNVREIWLPRHGSNTMRESKCPVVPAAAMPRRDLLVDSSSADERRPKTKVRDWKAGRARLCGSSVGGLSLLSCVVIITEKEYEKAWFWLSTGAQHHGHRRSPRHAQRSHGR